MKTRKQLKSKINFLERECKSNKRLLDITEERLGELRKEKALANAEYSVGDKVGKYVIFNVKAYTWADHCYYELINKMGVLMTSPDPILSMEKEWSEGDVDAFMEKQKFIEKHF